MAFSVADSLLSVDWNKQLAVDVPDMARRFAEEYKLEPRRGYGGTVINVSVSKLMYCLLLVCK